MAAPFWTLAAVAPSVATKASDLTRSEGTTLLGGVSHFQDTQCTDHTRLPEDVLFALNICLISDIWLAIPFQVGGVDALHPSSSLAAATEKRQQPCTAPVRALMNLPARWLRSENGNRLPTADGPERRKTENRTQQTEYRTTGRMSNMDARCQKLLLLLRVLKGPKVLFSPKMAWHEA